MAEWSWPDSMDALTAAPSHHTLLFENDRVRVLDTRVPPGETVPVHTHRFASVLHVRAWSDCVRRDATGTIVMDSRAMELSVLPESVQWSEPLPPHTLENVGSSEIHVIAVEIKP
jgi:hypothetical protein